MAKHKNVLTSSMLLSVIVGLAVLGLIVLVVVVFVEGGSPGFAVGYRDENFTSSGIDPSVRLGAGGIAGPSNEYKYGETRCVGCGCEDRCGGGCNSRANDARSYHDITFAPKFKY